MITFPKLLIFIAVTLFGLIGITAYFKNDKTVTAAIPATHPKPIEVSLGKEMRVVVASPKPIAPTQTAPTPSLPAKKEVAEKTVEMPLPDANRVEEFFNKVGPTFPIVETITYKSRAAWQKGRPAWLSDYASHYHTSRHFIARSLNGRPDYLKQDIAEGARFNVLRLDKDIHFHLVVDISRCKMWFYYEDRDDHERVLVKTYPVSLGRIDGSKVSGCLTPLGKYSLGSKTAVYKPSIMGSHKGERIEMITLFGTRWIPFDKEIENCSAPSKGFGLHGVPWSMSNSTKTLTQDCSSLGKHESDGCIRLASEDIEELFAIIITKPTTIELVKDFYDAR